MSITDEALTIFSQGYNCAQAVLMACGPALGIDQEACARIAAAYGGGIARTGEMCGAVTAAIMVIGLQHWGVTCIGAEAKAEIYRRGQDFLQQFSQQHNSLLCRELLGCDISTSEGMAFAREQDFHNTLCPRFIRTAVELLEKSERS